MHRTTRVCFSWNSVIHGFLHTLWITLSPGFPIHSSTVLSTGPVDNHLFLGIKHPFVCTIHRTGRRSRQLSTSPSTSCAQTTHVSFRTSMRIPPFMHRLHSRCYYLRASQRDLELHEPLLRHRSDPARHRMTVPSPSALRCRRTRPSPVSEECAKMYPALLLAGPPTMTCATRRSRMVATRSAPSDRSAD